MCVWVCVYVGELGCLLDCFCVCVSVGVVCVCLCEYGCVCV